MAEVKVEGPELKKLVKLSKKQPLAFAFSPGKKRDEHVMAIDRRKSGSFLAKNAKKESTGMKVAFGTCTLNGKLLTMTCEQAVPTMAKTLKAYLKTQNIKVNIEILDIDGNSLESDIEELPDDPDMMDDDDGNDAQEAQPEDNKDAAVEDDTDTDAKDSAQAENDANDEDTTQAEDDAARAKTLAARLKATQHDVMGTDGPVGETLKKVMAAAISMLKGGDLDKAEETIGKLEAALAKIGAAAPKDNNDDTGNDASGPDAVTLAKRAGALKQSIDAINGPAQAKLLAALGGAANAIKGGQLAAAAGALDKIEAAVAKIMDAPAPETASPEATAARQRLATLEQSAGQVGDENIGAKLTAALAKAGAEISGGDLSKATQMLDTIENAINNALGNQDDTSGQQDPNAAKWAAEEARVQKLVDAAIADKRGDLDAINRAFNYAKELAADGAYDRALATTERLDALLKEAAAATTTAAAADAAAAGPDNVVAYTQSRLAWIKTRQGLQSELETLKTAIDNATKDVEGLEDVASKSGVLFDYLDGIDSKLEDTLEALVETADGPEREALKSKAQGIIAEYRSTLDTEFFQAVDDNGFVKTNIRGSALESLQSVSAALAA